MQFPVVGGRPVNDYVSLIVYLSLPSVGKSKKAVHRIFVINAGDADQLTGVTIG